MADEHEIESLIDTAMHNLWELVDVNTIIGNIIESAVGATVLDRPSRQCRSLSNKSKSCSIKIMTHQAKNNKFTSLSEK